MIENLLSEMYIEGAPVSKSCGARSTCFVYKGKPVSFDGFSYGRKTLFVASGHYSGQAGYYGYLCTRLPTSLWGQALVNKHTNKHIVISTLCIG